MNWFTRFFTHPADRIEEQQRAAVNTLYVNSAGAPVRHERSLEVRTTSKTPALRAGLEQVFAQAYRSTERYEFGWFDPRTGVDTRRRA